VSSEVSVLIIYAFDVGGASGIMRACHAKFAVNFQDLSTT
jgi:hypothetical protein